MTAALLHEPAVGSLLPGLLAPFRDAYASGGTAAFAAALYGPAWTPAEAPPDADAVVARDLAMFAAFEPAAPDRASGPVVITVGECSPSVRHESVRRLAGRFALTQWTIPGARHAAHLEHPEQLAAAIRRLATSGPSGRAARPGPTRPA
jgi:pimeloyl-ACP methyl ester carboxylesterase